MILVVDSGGTKSSWNYMSSDLKQQLYNEPGINLSTIDLDSIHLPNHPIDPSLVSRIFFFGAGTGHSGRREQFKDLLKRHFSKAITILVGSDLQSAGLALAENERCIIGIIGTGSNACIFKEGSIEKEMNSLGYHVGDEGSGLSMGRDVLRYYFYGKMPAEDAELFENKYPLTRDQLIERLYHQNQTVNTYLASFSTFLSECTPALRAEIATRNLSEFFEYLVEPLQGQNELPIHFSGSISWHFRDIIRKICRKYDYKLGNIIQNPIDSLTYSKLNRI